MSLKQPAPCISVLGTGSDVGKSIVAAALCRLFKEMGFRVAPFKAQNMSNNSFVTREGGEMGRAQVVQAEAAGVEPHVDMNPVLLKPGTDQASQVVVHGQPAGTRTARDYFSSTDALFGRAKESLTRLRDAYDLVVMEGAGSCAEVNLRERDFVNFKIAHVADAPVILVADIDRGGVFAQIIGTLAVLPEEDRARIKGIIINRFRGDASLFDDGIAYIEQRTGLPVLGLIPWFRHIEIDSEDGVPLDFIVDPPMDPVPGHIHFAVIRLPHISNFTDFAPLHREPWGEVHYLSKPRPLAGYDAVILPGTKNTRGDMGWLRETGWDRQITEHATRGGMVAGICGGLQMLGRTITDLDGVEGPAGCAEGLGLLGVDTCLDAAKVLTRSEGMVEPEGCPASGYEIHMGVTRRDDATLPFIQVSTRNGEAVHDRDGAQSRDGRIWGSYFHGIFDAPEFRATIARRLMPDFDAAGEWPATPHATDFKAQQYDLLAEHFRKHLDLPTLLRVIDLEVSDA